jgi:ATP-dependent Clp protease adaptor protein ClpS
MLAEMEVEVEEAVEAVAQLEKIHTKEIILHNDDVNTFDHVIECLMRICNHTLIQAEQCAHITHYNGKCSVKRGAYEKLRPMCEALQEQGLSAEISG